MYIKSTQWAKINNIIFHIIFTVYTLRFVKVLLKFYWLIDWSAGKLFHEATTRSAKSVSLHRDYV